MEKPEAHWEDRERAGKYANQVRVVSKLAYTRLARQVSACVEPSSAEQTFVDLGCGPGFLGIELGRLRPQARIVGVDPSGEMLRIARGNAALAALVRYEARQGCAEEMPLESACADLVISQSSFHEWEDPRRGLQEVYRVLKPGGCVIIKDYNLLWLSAWKRKLLGLLHPLHMFKFGFDDVASMAGEVGFGPIQGKPKGLQYCILATKPDGDRQAGEARPV